MKRSNRLVLLVGVFLAIVAFVGHPRLAERRRGASRRRRRTDHRIRRRRDGRHPAVAPGSRPTRSRPDETRRSTRSRPAAFTDPSQVVGQIARQPVATGGQITSTTLNGGAPARSSTSTSPAGHARHGGPGRPGHRRRHGHQDRRLRRHGRRRHGRQVPGHHGQPGRRLGHRRQRPQQHERQAPAPGHAGPRHAAAAAAQTAAAPDDGTTPAPELRAARHGAQRPAADRRSSRSTAQQAEVIKFAQLDWPRSP